MPDVAQHLSLSHKLQYEDLDWALARKHGISEKEAECLQFFADIESQTVYYMMEALKTDVAKTPELLTFLTIWNYEEFFHAQAITKFLNEVGQATPPAAERSKSVRGTKQLRATLEDWFQQSLAKTMPQTFVCLWQTWGAAAELITTQAYEQMMRDTENPVLAELCRRIAKQERRHFAWYFETARERLTGRPVSQKVVRRIFDAIWTPVGSGVKTPAQIAELIARLFPGQRIYEVFGMVDRRISQLPGMQGFHIATRHADRIQALLPPHARVVRERVVDTSDRGGEEMMPAASRAS